jgi:hypothetical protein
MTHATIDGKRMTETAWNKAFAKAMKSIVGDGYQVCQYDWTEARYLWHQRIDPRRAASKVAERRINQGRNAEVVQIRVWRDRYTPQGIYDPSFDGEIEVRPEILDAGTNDVIREMFAKGQSEGVFMVWRPVADRRFFGDVEPVLVKWSAL